MACRRALVKASQATNLRVRRLTEYLHAHSGEGAATATLSQGVQRESEPCKTLQDLDGPPAWPVLGNFFMYIKKENRGRLHEALADQHKQYGKMFKEKLGPNWQLHVADPDLFMEIYMNHGKYPMRPPFNAWILHRKDRGRALGLLTSQGETWYRLRKSLNKKMLKPKSAKDYTGVVNDVSKDLVHRIHYIRGVRDQKEMSQQLANELYKWSMESIASVLFETRLGCLNKTVPERAQAFIDASLEMMSSSFYVMVGEEVHRKFNTRFWKRHAQSWDKLFDIGQKYIDERLHAVASHLLTDDKSTTRPLESTTTTTSSTTTSQESSESHSLACVLTHMLAKTDLSRDEMYSNLTELLMSGVDTTSNSLSFTLHLLAQHPDVQERLYGEIDTVLGHRDPTFDDFSNMPYLKAVLKESQRLYPVGTMNVRVLPDDTIIKGYKIPKKTLCVLNVFAVGRDETVFDQADKFLPERWTGGKKYHPFASLPFGYGSKVCLGRNIAKMELYIALIQVCRSFKLRPVEGIEMKPMLRTLLTTGENLPIEFVDREPCEQQDELCERMAAVN